MTVPPTYCGVFYVEGSRTGEDMIFGLPGRDFIAAMSEHDADRTAFLVAGAIFDLAYWGGDPERLADYVQAAMAEWATLPFDRLEALAQAIRQQMPCDGITRGDIAEPLMAVLTNLFCPHEDVIIIVAGPGWATDICPN
jgi:hypothetical protein